MFGDATTSARLEPEHAERERGCRRAIGDPERAWLADPSRHAPTVAVDRRRARRALQTVVLAVLSRAESGAPGSMPGAPSWPARSHPGPLSSGSTV